jgi:hypothetical protein
LDPGSPLGVAKTGLKKPFAGLKRVDFILATGMGCNRYFLIATILLQFFTADSRSAVGWDRTV